MTMPPELVLDLGYCVMNTPEGANAPVDWLEVVNLQAETALKLTVLISVELSLQEIEMLPVLLLAPKFGVALRPLMPLIPTSR